MNKDFIEFHVFNILNTLENERKPLDVFLSNYFRKYKNVGSKERPVICEIVYGMIRWRGFLDHFCHPPITWIHRYNVYQKENPLDHLSNTKIPPHVRVSFPKFLFQLISDAYGEKQAIDLCLLSNTRAPTTVRANALKISREELLKKWKGVYTVSPTCTSNEGIVFHKKINFFGSPEFKEGLFEIQDEGSQLIAHLIKAEPKQHVLDFCAGSGGKTLAFAPPMQNKGIIYLHDIRALALEESKKRLRRAGIQNAQQLYFDDSRKKVLKRKMDWILVDAPCSGLGTLRRNPDMKWKLDPGAVDRLVLEQRQIFQDALEFLHPKGKIVYATCSILPQENEQQAAYFQHTHSLELLEELKILPQQDGMDGFYGAVFQKKELL